MAVKARPVERSSDRAIARSLAHLLAYVHVSSKSIIAPGIDDFASILDRSIPVAIDVEALSLSYLPPSLSLFLFLSYSLSLPPFLFLSHLGRKLEAQGYGGA